MDVVLRHGRDDRLDRALVVGVGAEIAVADHRHPELAVPDQPLRERFSRCVLGSVELSDSAGRQEILQGFPAQFMGEFKGLNQPLAL